MLEVSARTAGNGVRIAALLLQVATDSHLWLETYDGELINISRFRTIHRNRL